MQREMRKSGKLVVHPRLAEETEGLGQSLGKHRAAVGSAEEPWEAQGNPEAAEK